MRTRVVMLVLLMIAMVVVPQVARAASLMLDNFTTGTYTKTTTCADPPEGILAAKTGSMVGGGRTTRFVVPCSNPLHQPATLDIAQAGIIDADGNGTLVVDTGIRVLHGLQVFYGLDKQGGLNALNLQLMQGGFDRLRLRFDASDFALAFNVVVFMHNGAGRVHAACHVAASGSSAPFNVDLRFATDFNTELGTPDWDDVDLIVLELGGENPIGGNDYALRSFSATNEIDLTARLCNGLAP